MIQLRHIKDKNATKGFRLSSVAFLMPLFFKNLQNSNLVNPDICYVII